MPKGERGFLQNQATHIHDFHTEGMETCLLPEQDEHDRRVNHSAGKLQVVFNNRLEVFSDLALQRPAGLKWTVERGPEALLSFPASLNLTGFAPHMVGTQSTFMALVW